MTTSPDFVDRIVAGVLEQLRRNGGDAPIAAPGGSPGSDPSRRTGGEAGRAQAASMQAASMQADGAQASSGERVVEILDDVITAALLAQRAAGTRNVVIGAQSILTPSARDFLAAGKIGWKRAPRGGHSSAPVCRWLAVVSRSSPAVDEALNGLVGPGAGWARELAGCHREAAVRAVSALCRGEFDGVVVFTGKPEAVACRANRNLKVRAASVATVVRAQSVAEQMGANVFAVDPADASAFELKRLLQAVARGKAPAARAGDSERSDEAG